VCLQRIIFVDSDQVVRTDLAELYHMNIRGAPYAYTPFCDNNKEMDEFRFWKGGFWHQHLQVSGLVGLSWPTPAVQHSSAQLSTRRQVEGVMEVIQVNAWVAL
jgi:hypothetical protein